MPSCREILTAGLVRLQQNHRYFLSSTSPKSFHSTDVHFRPPYRSTLITAHFASRTMDDESPLVRCPSCGSVLTGPLGKTGMWECRYHLCRAVFPMGVMQENGQSALVCEERREYLYQ